MSASISTPVANPQQILASVWQRNLPVVRSRIETLHAAAREASAGYLSSESRRTAADIAHKLAGSLGMFGYPRGTEIAQQLEVLLDSEGPVAGSRLQEFADQLDQALQTQTPPLDHLHIGSESSR